MTDPYADPAAMDAGDQTIPLVPESGYETLVDPWASGPGLGVAGTSDVTATQPLAVPESPTPVASQVQPGAYPQPTAYPSPAAYPRTPPQAQPAQSYAPYPSGQSQPAPSVQTAPVYPPQPYGSPYAEPNGPAANIPNQAYSAYAPNPYGGGQQWSAIADPVAYDYGYNRSPAASAHPNAVTSMVLGILGITVFSPLAPVAWYLAAKGRREMAADPYRWQPSGMLTAGLVLGVIGTVVIVLALLVIFFMIAMFSVAGI